VSLTGGEWDLFLRGDPPDELPLLLTLRDCYFAPLSKVGEWDLFLRGDPPDE